jgi:uncharacterized protein (DUF2062 family)
MRRIFEPIKNKVLIPFRIIPREGLSPEKLALSVTIGIIAGLFPVIGFTTLLSLSLTAIFRQNLALVQSVNWLMALVQVMLIIPLMRMGAMLWDQHSVPITLGQVEQAFQPGILNGLQTIGIFHLYGILAWGVLMIPVGAFSYYALLLAFRKRVSQQSVQNTVFSTVGKILQ